jgi:hypothetical protein
MANFYVGEVLFETGGTIDTPGDITVTAILDCAGTTGTAGQILSSTGTALLWTTASASGQEPRRGSRMIPAAPLPPGPSAVGGGLHGAGRRAFVGLGKKGKMTPV